VSAWSNGPAVLEFAQVKLAKKIALLVVFVNRNQPGTGLPIPIVSPAITLASPRRWYTHKVRRVPRPISHFH
jgi:hypothetical protein